MIQIEERTRTTDDLAIQVALARAYLDRGQTILDAYLPLVLDAIGSSHLDAFNKQEARAIVVERHGIDIPEATIGTLLNRCKRRGFVKRSGGKYHKQSGVDFQSSDLEKAAQEHKVRVTALCNRLRERATEKKVPLPEDNDKLIGLVLRVIDLNKVSMMLGEEMPPGRGDTHSAAAHFIAIFVLEEIRNTNSDFGAIVLQILESAILQKSLFLEDLDQVAANLNGLQVVFDTGLILAVLGYAGPTQQEAVGEFLENLRRGGADCVVFQDTIREVSSILSVYETRMGKRGDRLGLRRTDVTLHFLQKGYSGIDIAGFRSTLDLDIQRAGLRPAEHPDFDATLPYDFSELEKALSSPEASPEHPRVQHDVRCVQSVLTRRSGVRARSLHRSRAIFCTGSSEVVTSVTRWYRRYSPDSVSPIVHYQAVSNMLWLRNPRWARDLKRSQMIVRLQEVVAPSARIWDAFLAHLKKLKEQGRIDDAEALALMSEGYLERVLGDIEAENYDEESDPDAETMDEVVRRTKMEYLEEGKRQASQQYEPQMNELERENATLREQARVAEAARQETESRAREKQMRSDQAARRVASRVGFWCVSPVWIFAVGCAVLGVVLGGDSPHWILWVGAVVALLSGLALLWHGCSPRRLRVAIEDRVFQWLRGL